MSVDTSEAVEPPQGRRSGVMSAGDHAALMEAVRRLEHTSLMVRLAAMLGRQVSFAAQLVPVRAAQVVNKAAAAAMRVALHAALASLSSAPIRNSARIHRVMVAASGAAGGALGIASLPIELPVSTGLMLRSIADIARAEGEDIGQPETALACLQVFALDGRGLETEFSESTYFALRGLMARSVTEAARYVASRGLIDETAPALLRFTTQVASRFGVVVSQKFLAQATPVLGALGGAAVNLAFIEHFQSLAKGHFIVRRLERKYGADLVKAEYSRIAAARDPDEIVTPAA
ncbi:peptidase [Rhodoblastus sphagnicola]|uniref:Peptidase n=1 Tax=Rhodoblastus sphagnicola TaxID=333368 RepID=A0A2S6NA31_9HYPH|nr:EcsC family protein [Rhodoblastus sphagnicola]MBB4198857.1 hypothetical protein [Rhodoblastus sphagnicola]PPQ31476.1 peptidase [Rhodoblastus sphagnicola]